MRRIGDPTPLLLTAKRLLSEFFLFKRYPFNLYVSMIMEILLSFHEGGAQYFSNDWERMPELELLHLQQHYDLEGIRIVNVVGAGALPYTALYFGKHIRKQVFAIEKNGLSYLACLRLIRQLKVSTVTVIKEHGQEYHHYDNSLVIVVLHTRLKEDVLKKVLHSKCIAVVRLPLEENERLFEHVNLAGLRYTSLQHRIHPMVSVFIDNRHQSS